MRKCLLIILTGLLLTISAIGQSVLDKEIDFSVDDMAVSDALLSLCEKADIGISFQSNLLADASPITFQYKNKTVKFLLDACLKATEIGFKLSQDRIELYQKPPPIFIISGFLEDSLSGERLVSATVYDNISDRGTTTNEYGFYSLPIPRGKANLEYAYLGFKSKSYQINIRRDLRFNVPLKASITLQEIVITDKKLALKEGLSIEEGPNLTSGILSKLPAIGGEPDIIRYFQTLPGVDAGLGSFGGTHVRGGEADQNLVLLDGVPVYHTGHTFGLFSIFNEDIIKNAKLYKGKFPAKYGGRLSSIIDIQTKEGNNKTFKFGGGVSLVATNLFVEGPIKKDTTSYFVSFRRTHLDPIFNAISFDIEENNDAGVRLGYFFSDLNAKINHSFSERDKLFISFYKGQDKLFFDGEFDGDILFGAEETQRQLVSESNFFETSWGNTIFSTRWNHIWSPKLFSNTTFTYSKFGFNLFSSTELLFNANTGTELEIEQYDFSSDIQDIALKIDFDYSLNERHHLSFGGGVLERIFQPIIRFQELVFENEDFDTEGKYFEEDSTSLEEELLFATEFNFYLEDDFKISDKWSAQFGFHNAIFTSANDAWVSFQPRISMQYKLHEKGNLFAAYTRMGQFLHVLSPAGISMPFDLWVPSTRRVNPQNAHQLLLGTNWELPADFTFGMEVYHKKLNNLITYQAGIESILESNTEQIDWQQQVTQGEGWNTGLEVTLRRIKGKATGFINYSLTKAERRFDGLNDNQPFPFRYNRKHHLKIGWNQRFGSKFSVFALWTFGSGQFTTAPRTLDINEDDLSIDNLSALNLVPNGPINTFQLPDVHQLDLSFNWVLGKRNAKHHISFGLKNFYNRRNPIFSIQIIGLDNSGNDTDEEPFIYLPTLPSLRYSIKF